MAYPLSPHVEHDWGELATLARAFPFAHIFTTGAGGHNVTRLPFMVDTERGEITKLRAHMNAQNPQVKGLDGGEVLVAFSGPHSYVSPNWRADKGRGGTWDYTAVYVWGRVTVRSEQRFFETLINDLSASIEPTFKEISDAPVWTTGDAPEGYIDRLFPLLTAFEISVTKVKGISKLHQDFPKKDAISVSDHLARSDKADSHAVADQIRAKLSQR